VQTSPFLDETSCSPRSNPTGKGLSVESEGRLLALMLDMEVCHAVLAVEHAKNVEMTGMILILFSPGSRGTSCANER
jgi:hypothetical protein